MFNVFASDVPLVSVGIKYQRVAAGAFVCVMWSVLIVYLLKVQA